MKKYSLDCISKYIFTGWVFCGGEVEHVSTFYLVLQSIE